ncbi:MAG: hypothetical protein KatS3mg008_0779 [Acidimicrobiales bacterium]|nr:MAG: hypothetical protein KatS3mg008_0779 [Acidimicrobiales bacterium]
MRAQDTHRDVARVAANWEVLGSEDPLWAVLWDPAGKGGRWDLRRFFETGTRDADEMLERVRSATGVAPRGGRALDFGCGVGRITAALSRRFDRVDGVDVAESMIEKARRLCPPNCVFHLNRSPDLSLFESETFDLVHSRLVLQHLAPQLVGSYVREFVRVLRPGGVAVFDVPDRHRWTPRGVFVRLAPDGLLSFVRRIRNPGGAVMELHVTPEVDVRAAVSAAGGEVLDASPIADHPRMPLRKLCYVVRRSRRDTGG